MFPSLLSQMHASLSNGQMMDFLFYPWCKRIFGNIKIAIHLKAELEGRGISEIGGKAESRIRRDAPLSMNDLINPARRDTEVSTELVLTDAHGFEEFLKQNLSGMNWKYLFHVVTSIITSASRIYNFNCYTLCFH